MGVNDFIKIGDKIKQLRKGSGISQKEMAQRLGINVSTYSNYENNYREPNSEVLMKIAKELDVTIPYMLYEVENGVSYTNFQYFIDYCATIGISIETCVNDPLLSGVHYITLDDERLYIASHDELLEVMGDIDRFIKFVFDSMFKKSENSGGSDNPNLDTHNPQQSSTDKLKLDTPNRRQDGDGTELNAPNDNDLK